MAVTKDSKTIQDEYKENYETLAEGFRALDAEYKTLQTALQSGQLANGMNTKDASDPNCTDNSGSTGLSAIRKARNLVCESHEEVSIDPCSSHQANDDLSAERPSAVKEILNGSFSMGVLDIEDSSNAIDALTSCTSQRASKDAGSIKNGGSCAGSGSPCARCPIRFLDQQNPKEIATFFEEHKHELPRSHEICIKRFQDNAEGARNLDAKYGDLVNMIYGLGVKHKPLLPEDPEEKQDMEEQQEREACGQVKHSETRISEWANALPATEERPPEDGKAEDRISHFDRPLKDVRVGESPSRPWGEPYNPKDFTYNHESSQDSPGMKGRSSLDKAMKTGTERKAAKCPFQHLGAAKGTEEAPKPSHVNEDPPAGEDKHGQPGFGVGTFSEKPHTDATTWPKKRAVNFPLPEAKAVHDDPNYNEINAANTLPADKDQNPLEIYNHGTAVFNSFQHLTDTNAGRQVKLVNRGYLIVGYDGPEVPTAMCEMHL